MEKKVLSVLILVSVILLLGAEVLAFSSEPIENPAFISGYIWSQKSKTDDTRHELTSVDVSFENEDTGKIYRADIEYQYSYTMAYYSVEVPEGTYVVDKIKVIQSSPHKIYEGENGLGGFHWRETLAPNGSTTHNFYFY